MTKENEIIERLDRIEKLLLESKAERHKPLTLEQARRYLMMSKSYLYKLTSSGKIPFYRAPGGRILYFDWDELENWAYSNRVKTKAELKKNSSLSDWIFLWFDFNLSAVFDHRNNIYWSYNNGCHTSF